MVTLHFRCRNCDCTWSDETINIDSYVRYERTYIQVSSGMRFRQICPNIGVRCTEKTRVYCREIEANLTKKEVDACLSLNIDHSI